MLQGVVEETMGKAYAGTRMVTIVLNEEVEAGIASNNLERMVLEGFVQIPERELKILRSIVSVQPRRWISDKARVYKLALTESFNIEQFVLWMSPSLESITITT
jgi:hypothetical protein